MSGSAVDSGMSFARAYSQPAVIKAIQPVSRAARKAPSFGCIGLILASGIVFAETARAADAPPDLVRKAAHMESETQRARDHFTYRQSVTVQEMSEHGTMAGEYREVRDVIFSPTEERTEEMVGRPIETLKNLKLTEEDLADIRNIHPFVLVEELLPIYETKFRGEEN